MPTIYQIIIASLLAAFIILFISKIGLRDLVIEKGKRLISRAFSCDFCLSFWANVLICLVWALISGDTRILLTPFLAAPLTRILL